MKNYSHKTTDENALELLIEDAIGRTSTVHRFIKLLSNMEDDCYSVALNGEWGAGKTFFVKQVKLILDTYNPQSALPQEMRETVKAHAQEGFVYPANYITVYYDAWANDNHVDPTLSLIHATISSGQSDGLIERGQKIGEVAAAIAEAVTQRNIPGVLKSLQGADRLAPVKEADNLKDLVKDFLNTLIEERGDRLVVFVDELDRCRPDYAICLLERIKHFFDDERVTFVFAVNLSQLQSTVKSYYGAEFNATRYLDKFFDLQMFLPHVNYDSFLRHLGQNGNSVSDGVCIETAKHFNFSLRETERYIRIYKIARKAALARGGFSEQKARMFAATYFVPIMLGLQMSDTNHYINFLLGKDYGPLLDILLSANVRVHTSWLAHWNEKFDEARNTFEDKEGNTVYLKDRLKEAYVTLFAKSRDSSVRDTHIGDMNFSEDVRMDIEEIVALLAPDSDYEFK